MGILNIRDKDGNTVAFPILKGKDGKSAYEYAKAGGYTGTEEEFYKKMSSNLVMKPLILYEANEHKGSAEYATNPIYGDEALQAILDGRQILVEVPNADNGIYTKIYSPIYMYQLPNYENEYLYLFYLKDTKQTIDLSAIGKGVIQLPEYGQLKMKLSHKYNECPL